MHYVKKIGLILSSVFVLSACTLDEAGNSGYYSSQSFNGSETVRTNNNNYAGYSTSERQVSTSTGGYSTSSPYHQGGNAGFSTAAGGYRN